MTDAMIIAQPNELEAVGMQQPSVMETATAAAAAQARAQVEARCIMALKRPRDWMVVRSKLLAECARPGFAETAIYKKPVGGQVIEGPSIRFMEAAARCMGNIYPEVTVMYDDTRKRIIRVQVTELESNLTYGEDLIIEKTVERKKLGKNQRFLSSRANSWGDTVFLVEATESEIANKQAAEVSKRIRNLTQRILPGDILDEAKAAVYRSMNGNIGTDTGAARKKVVDAFEQFGVKPEQLAKYLGHAVDEMTKDEIVDLRMAYETLRSKEATWAEILTAKTGDEDNEEDKPRPSEKNQRAKDKIKEAAQKAREKQQDAPAAEDEREREVPPVSDEERKELGYD